MSRYSIPLTANVALRLPYPGKMLQLISLGGAASVALQVEWGGDTQRVETMGGVTEMFKLYNPTGVFSAITLESSITTTVDILVSYSDMTFNPNDGVEVTAHLDASQFPLPVAVNSLPDVVLDPSNFPLGVGVLAFNQQGDRSDVAATTVNQSIAIDGAGDNLRIVNESDETALVKPAGAGADSGDADAVVVLARCERIIAMPAGATHVGVKLRAGTGTVVLQVGDGV